MPALRIPDETFFDRIRLEELIGREQDTRVRRRLRAILALMKGSKQTDVASALKCSTAAIREWVKRWDSGGYYALLDNRGGSFVTKVAREETRKNGYDLVREGSYFRMQPLALNDVTDDNGQPIQPLYFADWDRPSKTLLRNLAK